MKILIDIIYDTVDKLIVVPVGDIGQFLNDVAYTVVKDHLAAFFAWIFHTMAGDGMDEIADISRISEGLFQLTVQIQLHKLQCISLCGKSFLFDQAQETVGHLPGNL